MNWFKTKSDWLILLAILLVASYLRLGRLGTPSFWVDELDFVYAAKSTIEKGEPLLNSGYEYPRSKLFTWSVIGAYRAFGISEASSRLPAAIFGILTVVMIYVAGKGLFSRRTGLLAALFLALSPFAIGWSRVSRMYTLFQLLYLAGAYWIYRGFEKGEAGALRTHGNAGESSGLMLRLRGWLAAWGLQPAWLLLGSVTLLLSFTVHELAGLYALSFLIYLLLVGIAVLWARKSTGASPVKYLVTLSAIVVLGGLAFATLSPLQAKVKEGLEFLPKWAEVSSAQNRTRLLDYLFSEEFVPLNGFFVIGSILSIASARKAGVYLLMLLAAPVLLFTSVFSFQKNSYIFHVYPALVLLAAVALDRLIEVETLAGRDGAIGRWLESVCRRGWLPALVTVLFLSWMPFTFWFRLAQSIPRQADGQYNGAVFHDEWRQACEYVREHAQPDDVIVSTLPLTVQYYAGRADYNLNWANADLAHKRNIVSPEGRFIDYYSGTPLIENRAALQGLFEGHPRVWLIADNYRLGEAVYVPADVRTLVQQMMTREFETRRKTVAVFSLKKETAS